MPNQNKPINSANNQEKEMAPVRAQNKTAQPNQTERSKEQGQKAFSGEQGRGGNQTRA